VFLTPRQPQISDDSVATNLNPNSLAPEISEFASVVAIPEHFWTDITQRVR